MSAAVVESDIKNATRSLANAAATTEDELQAAELWLLVRFLCRENGIGFAGVQDRALNVAKLRSERDHLDDEPPA